MIFTTDVKVQQNNKETIRLPDMTLKFMVPSVIEIAELTGGRDAKRTVPARDIICRVFSGTEICSMGEPFFQGSNTIDLDPYRGFIEKNGRVSIDLSNKDKTIREFRITTKYVPSYGGCLMQERFTAFDAVVPSIAKLGRCTKLTLSFNKPIESLSFLTISSCIEGDWIESFSADVEGQLDEVFVFDFISPDLSAYMDYFDSLSLKVKPVVEEGSVLMAYVTAYGFPHVSK